MKRNIIIAIAGIAIVALAVFYFATRKVEVDSKAAATAFPSKIWFYSTDGGKNWVDRAEAGLKGFKENGEPIHILPEWTKAEWQDENTILWTAIDNTTSIWKSFDEPLSAADIANSKKYAAAFPSKTWYYSEDAGGHWEPGAAEGLKSFDQNGQPVHISEAWISARWLDENSIQWTAVNGNKSLWKAFESPPK